MNVNISEAWETWADLDDAAYGAESPVLDAAALLIPTLIVEIERLDSELTTMRNNMSETIQTAAAVITDPGIVVYLEFDDPAYDWGTVSFVVVGADDRIEDTVEDVVSVREFNSKFQVSNGKITYVVPKVAGETYELRKALTLW